MSTAYPYQPTMTLPLDSLSSSMWSKSVRLGVVKGEYHWHKHDKEDEFSLRG